MQRGVCAVVLWTPNTRWNCDWDVVCYLGFLSSSRGSFEATFCTATCAKRWHFVYIVYPTDHYFHSRGSRFNHHSVCICRPMSYCCESGRLPKAILLSRTRSNWMPLRGPCCVPDNANNRAEQKLVLFPKLRQQLTRLREFEQPVAMDH